MPSSPPIRFIPAGRACAESPVYPRSDGGDEFWSRCTACGSTRISTDVSCPRKAVRQKALRRSLLPEHIEATGLPVNPVFGSNPGQGERAGACWSEDRRCVALMAAASAPRSWSRWRTSSTTAPAPRTGDCCRRRQGASSRLPEVEWHLPAHVRRGFPVDDMPVDAGGGFHRLQGGRADRQRGPGRRSAAVIGRSDPRPGDRQRGVRRAGGRFWWKMQLRASRQSITG